ncbi:MAG TPA: plasmid partition protein ParG [Microvirga sp.]|nr:plasmid partition protein ParG [Microvirga sp.]
MQKPAGLKIPKAADPAEAWVRNRQHEVSAPAPVEPMKRFTIDVPVSLHTRIKTQCAMRGVKMADVLRELMDREFPKA